MRKVPQISIKKVGIKRYALLEVGNVGNSRLFQRDSMVVLTCIAWATISTSLNKGNSYDLRLRTWHSQHHASCEIKDPCGGWRTEENKMEGIKIKKTSSFECSKFRKNGIYYSNTKRSLSTIVFILLATFVATAQIKMVDETFKTNTDSISVLKAAIDFDKVFPKYGRLYCLYDRGLLNIDGEIANPVGEKIYLCEGIEGIYKKGGKYVVDTIPANKYYTYVGFVFGADNLDSVVVSLKKEGAFKVIETIQKREMKYDEKTDRTFPTGRMITHEITDVEKYLSGFSSSLTTEEYKKGNDSFYSYVMLYIMEDEEHNKYYYKKDYYNNEKEDYERWIIEMIPVSFYENVSATLKGKYVGFDEYHTGERITDAISGELITIKRTKANSYSDTPPTFDYKCTDVVVKDRYVLAVLTDGESSFAVPVNEIQNPSVDITSDDLEYNYWDKHCTRITCTQPRKHTEYVMIIKDGYDEFCQLKKLSEIEQKKKLEAARAENAKKAEKRKQEILNKYGQDIGGKILEGKVAIGMTKEMCLEAGWFPFRGTESLETAAGKIEVWTCFNSKLTFVGGKLTAIRRK